MSAPMRPFLLLSVLLPLVWALPLSAATEDTAVPRTRGDIALSFAPVVKKVAPAVVNIYTRKAVQQRLVHPFMSDPFFREFFSEGMPDGLTRPRTQSSLGSGVIVREDGLVVTNTHVIQGADQITVVLADRREFEADIITSDKRTDISVLRLKTRGERFPILTFRDSDTVDPGDLVLAIGNPFGVGQTVTMGIVSAVARAAEVRNSDVNYFIQTDAAINPGNSGGALVTGDGQLVGIPSAIYSRDGGSLGIGFAIPSNLVRAVLGSVKQDGQIERGWLGLTGQGLTADLARSLGLPRPSGVLVKTMHPASPARAAGLKPGDIILSVNGHEVPDEEALRFRVATSPVGSTLQFRISRDGSEKEVGVALIAAPESPVRQETALKGHHPLAGARIANLSPALAQELGLPDESSGVLVLAVAADSPAAMIGVQRGDILLSVNGADTPDVAGLKAAMEAQAAGWRLTIRRGVQVFTLAVRL